MVSALGQQDAVAARFRPLLGRVSRRRYEDPKQTPTFKFTVKVVSFWTEGSDASKGAHSVTL